MLRQEQSAAKLGVPCKTLSDWESGRIFPSLTLQHRIVEYLGYDPFVLLPVGTPKGNEPHGVAFLAPDSKATTGQRIRGWRIGLKKTRKQMAAEMGVSVKTLWGWENDLWLPIFGKDKLIAKGFAFSY